MRFEEFDRHVRSELRALTTLAEDIEDLAEDERLACVRQEMLGKAGRVYDVTYSIRYALDKLMLGGKANGE